MGGRGFGRGGGGGGFGRGGGGGRGGGRGFQKSDASQPRINSEVQIFIEGLPLDAKIPELVNFFSAAGQIKSDRLTRNPRVWLYHDKSTGRPTGECTITYRNNEGQQTALQMFDGQTYQGSNALRVTPSIVKAHMAKLPPAMPRGGGGMGRGRGDRGGGGKMMGRGGFDRGRGSRGGGFGRGFGREEGGFGSRGGFGRQEEGFGSASSFGSSEGFGSYGRAGGPGREEGFGSAGSYGGGDSSRGRDDRYGGPSGSGGYGSSNRYAPY